MLRKDREPPPPRLVDAQIRIDYRGFLHCDVRDLDMHGVFVIGQDGALTRLRKDAPVEVSLKLNANGRNQIHRLRARVEHRHRDGMSLVFTDADIDTYSALLQIGSLQEND